jgi:ABC-type transport system involved in multi-copper enzyme maturation permease subunit
MKVLVANIEDVMREAAARWTLLAYFTISTLFILIFAFAVNLDIVEGSLAGAKLFGNDVQMHGQSSISIEQLVGYVESGLVGFLFLFWPFIAIFATAHLVPRMMEKGTVDLYLSRPVGRVKLLLSRYLAGLLLAGSNIVYLIGAMWMIVVWKTHVAHPRFFVGGVIILFFVASLLAFAFLIGVVTSSTAVSIMMTYFLFLLGYPLVAHDRFAAAVNAEWKAAIIQGLYWIVPKSSEILGAVVAIVSEKGLPKQLAAGLTPAPFVSTAIFAIACLTLASYLFRRKEF